MKIGAERKKIAILSVLVAAAAVLFYINVISPSETDYKTPPRAAGTGSAAPGAVNAPSRATRRGPRNLNRSTEDFRPKVEAPADPSKVDPTLRLDLITRLQSVEREGGARNLFQFAAAPAPPAPKVEVGKIKPKTPQQIAAEAKAEAAKSGPPAKPAPPPITLKFYGYSTPRRGGMKRAFFLDGEDIYVAGEGELVKKRFKVVRIGVNSVVMEDIEHKHQQTLVLPEQPG